MDNIYEGMNDSYEEVVGLLAQLRNDLYTNNKQVDVEHVIASLDSIARTIISTQEKYVGQYASDDNRPALLEELGNKTNDLESSDKLHR